MSYGDDLEDDSEAALRSMTFNGGQLVGGTDETPDNWLELLVAHGRLGPRAQRVLLDIAQRMARAAETYGDDFERPADWSREAQEERLDALVYSTVSLELAE